MGALSDDVFWQKKKRVKGLAPLLKERQVGVVGKEGSGGVMGVVSVVVKVG